MTTLPQTAAGSAAPPIKELPGANFMLAGASGSGKTHAIRTLVEAGLEVFVLFTEPGMEVLADVPSDKLHWHYVAPASPDFADMLSSAEKINGMSFEMLTKLPDINKKKYHEFIDVLVCLSSFTDDRTGQNFGAVDDWGPDRVFVLDSLTGLSLMAMNLVTGSKPVKSLADWGVAIDNLERLLTKLCVDTSCHFGLLAHLEREVDELTGGSSLMASTLGRKLAPKLPRYFSDVIHVNRKGDKFYWSTASSNVDTKTRNLPLAENLPPTFVPLINNWRKAHANTTL
jgi:hypothetical protein